MATKINHKAGIRHTFDARPDLKEVHILPSGEHYFDLATATAALGEGEQLVTLTPQSDELKATAKAAPTPPAPTLL